jgi:hypothetical protein
MVLFAGGLMFFLVSGIAFVATYGIPGSTGGTSPSQQMSSGAPQPTIDIHRGDTRETTGAGAPVGARPPRR